MEGDTPDIWLCAIVSKGRGSSRRGDDNLERIEQIWFVGFHRFLLLMKIQDQQILKSVNFITYILLQQLIPLRKTKETWQHLPQLLAAFVVICLCRRLAVNA